MMRVNSTQTVETPRVMREIRVHTDPEAVIRTETMAGREYLVAPMVMLQEGVLRGANAKDWEFCPASALEQQPLQWNGRPLVQNHPQVQGVFVSANDPKVMEDWAYGFVFNARVESGKLKAEAWFDTARANELGGDFAKAIERVQNGERVEVSTGLFCEIVPETGSYNGKRYNGKWTNITSDHLAILSEGILGACSQEDGCGIPRIQTEAGAPPSGMRLNMNALVTPETPCACEGTDHPCDDCGSRNNAQDPRVLALNTAHELENTRGSYLECDRDAELAILTPLLVNKVASNVTWSDVYTILSQAIQVKYSEADYVYLYDCTSDVAVFKMYSDNWNKAGLYQINYAMDEQGNVKFSGEPEEVVLMTTILPKPKVNSAGSEEGAQPAEGTTAINVNNEGDAMAGVSTGDAPTDGTVQNNAGQPQGQAPAAAEPAVNTAPAAPAAPVSMQDWLNSVPPEFALMVQEGIDMRAQHKASLINKIKANASNTFTDEQLGSFDVKALEGIAALAAQPEPMPAPRQQSAPAPQVNYQGRGAPEAQQPTSEVHADTNQQQRVQEQGLGGAPPAPRVFARQEDFKGLPGARVH